MDTDLNIGGYYLYTISMDEWILDVKGGPIYAGTFKDVVKRAINLGFELDEIEMTVGEMLKNNHNASHFGIFKKLIYTFNKDFSHGQKAS